jgi:hypothetical protein
MAKTSFLSKRFLDPYDRVSEVLFGLIMVLTFTGSLSIAEATRDDVRTMLIGALGCNIAWGIIDGVLFLLGRLSERGQTIKTLRAVRGAPDAAAAQRTIADAMPPAIAPVLEPSDLDMLHQRLLRLPEPPARPRLSGSDVLGAIAVFFWVFITTFPVAIPFIFMHHVAPAMRVSNTIAVVMLFICGFRFAQVTGNRPWVAGFLMAILGCLLVGMTIALGG